MKHSIARPARIPLVAATALLTCASARAQVIDFETIPDGTCPSEGRPISDEFNVAPYFIRFELMNGTSPVLARVGQDRTAFLGPAGNYSFPAQTATDPAPCCDADSKSGLSCEDDTDGGAQADMPATNQLVDVGWYFLTDDGKTGSSSPNFPGLRVLYTVPTQAASGYILDIDNAEQYLVCAFSPGGSPLDSICMNRPGSQSFSDGRANFFSFDVGPGNLIGSITIELVAGSTKGIAFDLFSPTSACVGETQVIGAGTPGTGGAIPELSVSCAQVNSDLTLRVESAMGGAAGCLAIGLQPTLLPLLGGLLYTVPVGMVFHVTSGPAGAAGAGVFELVAPLGNEFSLVGETLYLQAGYADPNGFDGGTLTNGVAVRIGGETPAYTPCSGIGVPTCN